MLLRSILEWNATGGWVSIHADGELCIGAMCGEQIWWSHSHADPRLPLCEISGAAHSRTTRSSARWPYPSSNDSPLQRRTNASMWARRYCDNIWCISNGKIFVMYHLNRFERYLGIDYDLVIGEICWLSSVEDRPASRYLPWGALDPKAESKLRRHGHGPCDRSSGEWATYNYYYYHHHGSGEYCSWFSVRVRRFATLRDILIRTDDWRLLSVRVL